MEIDRIAALVNQAMFDVRNNPDKFDVDEISYEYAYKILASLPKMTGDGLRNIFLNSFDHYPSDNDVADEINKFMRGEK
jgi:hypothetical protein